MASVVLTQGLYNPLHVIVSQHYNIYPSGYSDKAAYEDALENAATRVIEENDLDVDPSIVRDEGLFGLWDSEQYIPARNGVTELRMPEETAQPAPEVMFDPNSDIPIIVDPNNPQTVPTITAPDIGNDMQSYVDDLYERTMDDLVGEPSDPEIYKLGIGYNAHSIWGAVEDHYGLKDDTAIANRVAKIAEFNGITAEEARSLPLGKEIKMPPAEQVSTLKGDFDWAAANKTQAPEQNVEQNAAPETPNAAPETPDASETNNEVLIIDNGKIFHGLDNEGLTDITDSAKDQVITTGSINSVTAQQLESVMDASGNPEVGIVKDINGPVQGLFNNNSYSLWYDAQNEQFTVIGEDIREKIENGNLEGTGFTAEQAERYMQAREATSPYLQDKNLSLDEASNAAAFVKGELEVGRPTINARISLEKGDNLRVISEDGKHLENLSQSEIDQLGDDALIQQGPDGNYVVQFDNGPTYRIDGDSINIPGRAWENNSIEISAEQIRKPESLDQKAPDPAADPTVAQQQDGQTAVQGYRADFSLG